MRTIDELTGPSGRRIPTHTTHRGQAAKAGVPLIPLPRESAQATARTAPPARAATAVPASASTGVADLLRGPVRPARVLMSLPAAVYLSVPTERGTEVVGVLTSDAARARHPPPPARGAACCPGRPPPPRWSRCPAAPPPRSAPAGSSSATWP